MMQRIVKQVIKKVVMGHTEGFKLIYENYKAERTIKEDTAADSHSI